MMKLKDAVDKCLYKFPENYGHTSESMREILEDAFGRCRLQAAEDVVFGKIDYNCPGIDRSRDLTEEEQLIYKEYLEYVYKVQDWIRNTVVRMWLEYHGQYRSKEKAVELAVKFWMDMLFETALQDNGSENEPHGIDGMLLGSMLKLSSLRKVTDEMKDNTEVLLRKYYLNNYSSTAFDSLSVDYGPCKQLYDILIEAGIDERTIMDICPWKTSLRIDIRDNSLYARRGYNKYETI